MTDGSEGNAPVPDEGDTIYPGGTPRLLERFEAKRIPFIDAEEVLPPLDVNLAELRNRPIMEPTETQPCEDSKTRLREMSRQLAANLSGQTELALLHGQVIAVLRRREAPQRSSELFQRLWREEGTWLATHLPVRWLISAATTFADVGATPEQRTCGLGLSVMFDMMKLHDTERRLSGQPGTAPFALLRGRKRHPLPFGMEHFSFRNGDLDRNMLARIARLGEQDPVVQPLAAAMLNLIQRDRRSIFARIEVLRGLAAMGLLRQDDRRNKNKG